MSEIKLFIDGNEVQLTSEQIEELSNKYSSYVENPLFRRGHNKPYFYIDTDGRIERAIDKAFGNDDNRYNVANYCTEEDVMVDRAKNEVLNRLLWQFSMKNCWGGAPWDAYTYKYFIVYDHSVDEWKIRSVKISEILGTVYFVSEEIAKRALNEIVIPFENGELEVCEIWDEQNDEWYI